MKRDRPKPIRFTSIPPLYKRCITLTLFTCAAIAFFFLPAIQSGASDQVHNTKKNFPKLMGMNIGEKHYDYDQYQSELAKLDLVILGFYRGWRGKDNNEVITMRDVVESLKTRNPDILVGQYTILNEFYHDRVQYVAEVDKIDKLDKEDWWLRDGKDKRLSWTEDYPVYNVNFLEWSKPDADEKRWPEWLAARDNELYFSAVPEFDIWYFDNVMEGPRVKGADWRRTGNEQSGGDTEIRRAFRQGHAKEWVVAKQLAPNTLLMGNADNDLGYSEYRNQLHAVFHEGLMGLRWSLETWAGWDAMMSRYFSGFDNTLSPHVVGFNVHGSPRDYQFFRYAFASCLMGNGYFSFTDKEKGYSSVPWFDEYDIDLGSAVDPVQRLPFLKGVYKRTFEKGMVLVNPTSNGVFVDLDSTYYKVDGKQDRPVNNGKRVMKVFIGAKDGLVLTRFPSNPEALTQRNRETTPPEAPKGLRIIK